MCMSFQTCTHTLASLSDTLLEARRRLKKINGETDGSTTDFERGRKRLPSELYKENKRPRITKAISDVDESDDEPSQHGNTVH